MSRDDAVRVQHMIDAIEAAVRFAQGRSRSDLDRDEMLLFALVRAVEILGEAASKLSGEGRAQMPQVPWSAVIGMRNRLVHAYFDIDRDILWRSGRARGESAADVAVHCIIRGTCARP